MKKNDKPRYPGLGKTDPREEHRRELGIHDSPAYAHQTSYAELRAGGKRKPKRS
jgi:hypothetical protein